MIRILLIAVLIIGSVLVNFQPAHAATTTLTVTGEGGHYTAGGKYQSPELTDNGTYTNVTSDDDGATVFLQYGGLTASAHDYTFSACPDVTISSLTLNFKERKQFGIDVQPTVFAYIDGTLYYHAAHATITTSYETHSYTWNTNPKTGVAWTADDINSATFGASGVGTNAWWISYITITITYTATTPTVSTQAASSITPTSALLNGSIDALGGSTVTQRGFVWATSSKAEPGNVAPASSGYSDNWTESSSYSTGSFSHTISSLSAGTAYYFRSYGYNSSGWAYGDEETFATIGTPSVSTVAATNIATTTATLNATVTYDSGEACQVRFAYDNVTRASFNLYAHSVTITADNYTTGESASYNLTGLTIATTYYFRVMAINTSDNATGDELTFLTSSTVAAPTSVTVIPSSTSLSISWIKGTGASGSLVRYQTGTYPTSTSMGTLAYMGTGESVQVTGLYPGNTYFVSIWGYTATTYSGTYATGMATTLAYDASSNTTGHLATPTTDSTWIQTPSSAKLSTIPVFGTLVQNNATAYEQPVNYMWYFIWMLVATGIGVVVYLKGNYNFMLAFACAVLFIGVGVWWLNVVAGIIVVGFAVLGIGWSLVGFRRTGT